jgi:hypothetical protein
MIFLFISGWRLVHVNASLEKMSTLYSIIGHLQMR